MGVAAPSAATATQSDTFTERLSGPPHCSSFCSSSRFVGEAGPGEAGPGASAGGEDAGLGGGLSLRAPTRLPSAELVEARGDLAPPPGRFSPAAGIGCFGLSRLGFPL